MGGAVRKGGGGAVRECADVLYRNTSGTVSLPPHLNLHPLPAPSFTAFLIAPLPPPPSPLRRLRVEVMARVVDRTPDELAYVIEDELRVITENP